jgi:hypothetical protein
VNPLALAPSRLARAAEALGWTGPLRPGLRLLDAEVAAVTAGPELVGLMVEVRDSWRSALGVARACLPLAPTALSLTTPDAPSELCLLECGYAEVGLVLADGTLAAPARAARPLSARAVDRAQAAALAAVLADR